MQIHKTLYLDHLTRKFTCKKLLEPQKVFLSEKTP